MRSSNPSSKILTRSCRLAMFMLPALMLLCGAPARGQSTFGSIVGAVSDATESVVPGAKLTLINLATNESRSTVADSAGLYQFLNLLPASYRLQAEHPGFKQFVWEPVVVGVQQTVRIDVRMLLGSVTETVEVKSITPLLQPATSSLGEVVERRKVEDLPLNGRNPLALVALVPGVVPQGFSQDAPAVPNFYAWGNFQIGGAMANQSEAMLDGGSLHGSLMNGVRFVPTEDTIQEFKVQTNNLSAEFGHTAGGIINLTSKSGANTMHGSLFEFFRNEVLDANNFFNDAKGVGKPAFTQNQFGGTLGGAVRRDKLFFFGSYEGFRQRRGRPFLLTVPTLEQREGDFSKTFDAQGRLIPIYDPTTTRPDPNNPGRFLRDPFPGNIIPQNRLDPAAKILAKQIYGAPNVTGAPFTNINNFAANAPVPADADQ